MINIIKKYWKYMAVILCLFFLVCWYRSCGMSDGYLKKMAVYESKIKDADAQFKALDAQNKASVKEIDGLTKKISQMTKDAGKPTDAEKAKDKTIAELQAKIAEAEKTDCPKALSLAKDEISQWSDKFTLATKRYDDAIVNINTEWTKKFNLQVSISVNLQSKFDTEHKLRLTSEEVSAQLKRDLRKAKLFSNVKTGVIIGVAAYVAYTLIKK